MNQISGFFSELLFILTEMAPYLLLGFFFAGLLHLLFPKDKVRKYMGKDKWWAPVNASLLGVPLPLCSCGVIPTGISFFKHGASKGSTVSFFISTPQTGVDSILVTYSMLGLPFAVIRPIVALLTGVAGGIITDRVDRTNTINTSFSNNNERPVPAGIIPKIREMFRYAFVEFLQDISNWLIIGLLVAALISVVVPDDFFAGTIGNEYLSMLIILLASIPVYICATASVPIAAILMLKGLSPGAALVLLMAGPATNAATIAIIGKVMGKKALLSYLGSIITGALLFGLIINELLPREWFAVSEHFGHMSHEHSILPPWMAVGSAILLVLLIINGYIRKFATGKKMTANPTQEVSGIGSVSLSVSGMTCNHCKANVENSAVSVEGVTGATADLATGKVTISGTGFDLDSIRANIESVGYKVND